MRVDGQTHRLLQRQGASLLPCTVERGVVAQRVSGRADTPLVGSLVGRRQRQSRFLAYPLGSAPKARSGQRAAERSADCRESLQRIGDPWNVAELPPDRQALFVQRSGQLKLELIRSDYPEGVQRRGRAPSFSELAHDREALLVQRSRRGVVALGLGHIPRCLPIV